VRHSACSSHLLGAPAPQRPQRRTARAAAQPFISHPLRAPQHEWRRTSSTRVAADFLNARRKPAKGPRPRMKTFGNWVHILVIKWQVRFAKFLEMFYFSPSYLFSRVDKRQQIAKKKCQLERLRYETVRACKYLLHVS
jgi:hypothetical protein